MKVLGFGAVLWDEIEGRLNIGGAVFNLVVHAGKLGSSSSFITAIGNDDLGEETLQIIRTHGVDTSLVQAVANPTCVVKVYLGPNGTPSYTIPEFTSWDLIRTDELTLHKINEASYDYFCFGTIEQRNAVSRNSLRVILEHCTFGCVFLDLNLRLHFFSDEVLRYSLKVCDILKLNEEEAQKVADSFGFAHGYEFMARSLHEEFGIELICITEGDRGAFLWSTQGSVHCRGYRVDVKDSVGAGDAFSAGLLHGHYRGVSLSETGDFACRLGALIASKRGAVPQYNRGDIDGLIDSPA